MKRIKAACICQTLHFQLKEEAGRDYDVKEFRDEVAHYKASLEANRTKYRILEETQQPDGSILLKLIKQYNQCPIGDYLNEGPGTAGV